MSIELLTIAEVMDLMQVGRRTAEAYARESGALLPRVKGGEYKIRKQKFMAWAMGGGIHEAEKIQSVR